MGLGPNFYLIMVLNLNGTLAEPHGFVEKTRGVQGKLVN